MGIRERLSGNEAIAVAMRQINPDVVAAFPITPSTEIPQYFSQFVANGQVETEFVAVESEHSAMSACIGAQAAGARTMTATSSNGLALMWEMLYIASAARLPITLACVNRALSGPLNIHNDHGDSMGARDSGWIQIYSENGQEAYDNFIQAIRIGENKEILLPVMVCQDGFITSHAVENIELLEDEKVKAFVGDYHPDHYLLNKQEHIAVGPLELPAHCFEHKRNQAQAMIDSKKVILDVAREYEKLTGRKYELFETYRLDDAEIAMIIINSSAGTAKVVVDALREKGIKAGLLKIRVFRPFPAVEIADAIKHIKVLAIMDKAEGLSGEGGPLCADIKSALYGRADGIKIINYIYGLGGRDVRTYDLEKVFYDLAEIQKSGKFDYKKTIGETYRYIGVRE